MHRPIATIACLALLTPAGLSRTAHAQPLAATASAPMQQAPSAKPLPSPPADASVTLAGKSVVIRYNAPSLRGRKMIGGENPYGKVWRTGANPATTLVTAANLKIGDLTVPAGTYTIYSLPSADTWQLIINRQTGQWGTVYNQDQDLGRTPMSARPMTTSQEVMSISFENTHGNTTELHIRWDKFDEFVKVSAQ